MTDSQYANEKARLYQKLGETDPQSAEYDNLLRNLAKLAEAERIDRTDPSPPDKLRKDTLLTVGASLVTTCLVLFWEHSHPIATKAFGFIPKLLR